MTTHRPNVLILCMDQWDMHMDLPDGVELPTLRRLESLGVTLDRQYCTVAICTPSRSTMWTGQHAKVLGMWDNTNFPWISSLDPDTPTVGTMMREQGYYTAFKGKWHLSAVPPLHAEGLEPYGFSDYQLWGDMYGAPLQGEMLDGTVALETVDWLAHKAPKDQPWLLVSSMVNPHDIMYLADTDEGPTAGENAIFRGELHDVQNTYTANEWWNPDLPANFDDDLSQQPTAPRRTSSSSRSTTRRCRRAARTSGRSGATTSSTACAWWTPSSAESSPSSTGRTCGRTPSSSSPPTTGR